MRVTAYNVLRRREADLVVVLDGHQDSRSSDYGD